jgi:hypothetical protein
MAQLIWLATLHITGILHTQVERGGAGLGVVLPMADSSNAFGARLPGTSDDIDIVNISRYKAELTVSTLMPVTSTWRTVWQRSKRHEG